MSNLNLDDNQSTYQIRAYQPGKMIRVNDTPYNRSIIIAPESLIENWHPQTVNELDAAAFAQIIGLKPDILLIGTGSTHIFIPVEAYGELINAGIGVEVMDTGAACRTFNALSAENRKVVAALLV